MVLGACPACGSTHMVPLAADDREHECQACHTRCETEDLVLQRGRVRRRPHA